MSRPQKGASSGAPKRRSGRSLTPAERRANGLVQLQGIWIPIELMERLKADSVRLKMSRTAMIVRMLETWVL